MKVRLLLAVVLTNLFLTVSAQEGKFGYIDKTGKFVIAPQFADAGSFWGGIACVSMGGDKWWYINKNGEKVYHDMDGANELFDFERIWMQDIDAKKAGKIE